jgi:hypothetical protein
VFVFDLSTLYVSLLSFCPLRFFFVIVVVVIGNGGGGDHCVLYTYGPYVCAATTTTHMAF